MRKGVSLRATVVNSIFFSRYIFLLFVCCVTGCQRGTTMTLNLFFLMDLHLTKNLNINISHN